MAKWSDRYNKLPRETRHITSMIISEMRINQLKMEKERLKKRYRQSCKEVNDHIRNLEKWIEDEGNHV